MLIFCCIIKIDDLNLTYKDNLERNFMRKLLIIIITVLIGILIMFIIYFLFLQETISLELKGSKFVKMYIDDIYDDEGAEAKLCTFFHCKDISNDISINNTVNNQVIGEYDIVYSLNYKTDFVSQIRKVQIIDNIDPIIELKGSDTVTICPHTEYIEDGYIAIDNYDGDITSNVVVKKKDNEFLYYIQDSSGNEASAIRKVIEEDTVSPVLQLIGPKKIKISINSNYKDQGVTALDNCDDKIASKVKEFGLVDTKKAGTYKITYIVTDESGNNASIKRTIEVENPINLTINNTRASFIDSLERYIANQNYNVSLGYVNLKTGYTYTYRPSTTYYGASLVKTVDALYAYEKMQMTADIKDKVEKAISVSDNQSHKELVDLIGYDTLKSYGRALGASSFLSSEDYYGNTTVNDQIAIWKYLYNFINSNSNGAELKKYFINDYANYLLFNESPTIMHKYGYYGIYFHDVGIVFSDNPYLIVILTKHGKEDYKSIISDLSSKLYIFNQIVE